MVGRKTSRSTGDGRNVTSCGKASSNILTKRDEKTFQEYGLRFDIEENFLDDKSNGFQLEASLIRSAHALTRLCLVLAMTTLYLVAQGTEVVKQGKRRWVDPHWFRGQSYMKIGWHWVKLALSQGLDLITHVHEKRSGCPAACGGGE